MDRREWFGAETPDWVAVERERESASILDMAARTSPDPARRPPRPASTFDILLVLFIVGVAVAIVVGVAGG